MDQLFLTILNMSLNGAFVIVAICLARMLFKKAPKIISYCLWAVAGFRLIFPFSIEGVFSLLPFKAQVIPQDIAMQPVPHINSGVTVIDNIISGSLPVPSPLTSANPLQVWIAIGSLIWVLGLILMLIYGIVSYIVLKRKMQSAAHAEANIYEADNIRSPFVLGISKPKIYLPRGLSAQEQGYILLHEQTHIRRRDYIVRPAAYFILCLHWFNPLAWVAFLLMGVDMEMSCDEHVLKEISNEAKKDYSLSLLSLATDRHIIGGNPLSFGEGGIKARIKNILNFRKPSQVIISLAVALAVVFSAGFTANRATDGRISIMPMFLNDVVKEATTSYKPRKWFDYYLDGQMPWDHSLETELPEYSDTVFRYTPYEVKSIDSNGDKTLFSGMPIWNVYFADLTNDGLPEFCATVSIGSGIIDTRVIVYDYATGDQYDLSDRMLYDYALSMERGQLIVTQSKYNGAVLATGYLAMKDGKLVAVGIDRRGAVSK